MNILNYSEFINESTTLAALKTRERLKSGIVANKQNIADVASYARGESRQSRQKKIQEINQTINTLTAKMKEEKDSGRKHEIRKQIQKYIKQRRHIRNVDNFWG